MVSYEEYIDRVKKYYRQGQLYDTHHNVGKRSPIFHKNSFVKDGKVLVSEVNATKQLKKNVEKAIDLIGGLGKSFKKSDRVLIVANFNSDDPYPATTAGAILARRACRKKEIGSKSS